MLNFEFSLPTKLIFGKETHKTIGGQLGRRQGKLLLHYGSGSIRRNGVYKDIAESLAKVGLDWVELGGVVPNPRLELVREGIDLCRKENIDYVLAVGGGSVIDSAKAIAAGVSYGGDVWDFFTGSAQPAFALPLAVVLTIPASGSESSGTAVINHDELREKKAIHSEAIKPELAIVNAELFLSLPRDQMANGVSDIISHILERYFSTTRNTLFTDGLCESALRTVMHAARQLTRDMKDYDAWAEIALAGTMAHNGIFGLGRREDWACHAMEHDLSAQYDVAHGAGLAVLTPAWMKYVFLKHLPIFAQFAIKVMGVTENVKDLRATALEGILRLEQFYAEIGLPGNMEGLGIGPEKFEMMAKHTTAWDGVDERHIGGLECLGWKDILAIYKSAI